MLTPALSIVEAPKTRRVMRSPTHDFYLVNRPYQIQPCVIAPVLPGETLKNLQLQSRVVTDPITNKLVGWWQEYYFFYVKLRDLPSSYATAAENMILDASLTLSSVDSTDDLTRDYFAPGAGEAVNWVKACLESVVLNYFRDEGEAWDSPAFSYNPIAKLNQRSFCDSLYASSEVPTGEVTVADEDLPDFERRYQTWMLLRQQKMTLLTFEDYLATFGVNVPNRDKKGVPELIRYIRDWTYPTNTVNSSTGAVTTACSWSIAERADKDRFFTEPGFIFGVSLTRPKNYRSWQKQNATVMLDNAFAFMPAVLSDDPSSSLRSFAADASNSPIGSTFTAAHILDVRDLYLYGDQFTNTTPGNSLPLLAATHPGTQYPTAASMDALFTAGASGYIRQDGVVKLNILGTQIDHT